MPAGLATKPELPKEAMYLWSCYCAIRSGCDGALTYSDVAAYNKLMGDALTPWETETLIRLDIERRNGN